MRVAPFVLVAALCAGSAATAQAPSPPPPAGDVKVVAQVISQSAGILAALRAMALAGDEPEFVTMTSRGTRLATTWRRGSDAMSARPGRMEIVDVPAQVTNVVNYAARTFTPMSFADLTRQAAESHRNSFTIRQAEEFFSPADSIAMPTQSAARAKRFDHIAQTEETGQARTIAGITARQILVSVRVWDRTKSFDDNGGWVVNAELWVGPRTPALDHLVARQRDYARTINKGVYDAVFTSVELPDAVHLDPMFPELMPVATRVIAEIAKLDGTVLASRTTYEIARSAKEMTAAVHMYQAMERAAGKPVTPDPSAAIGRRERLVMTGFEYLAIDYAVTDLDVEIPPGFTLKKR